MSEGNGDVPSTPARQPWERDLLDELDDEIARARAAAAVIVDRLDAMLALRERAIDLARTSPLRSVTVEELLQAGDEIERARVAALADRAWP